VAEEVNQRNERSITSLSGYGRAQQQNTTALYIINMILHCHCKERPLLQNINTFLGLRRTQVGGGH
jgi:hypothetical protein